MTKLHPFLLLAGVLLLGNLCPAAAADPGTPVDWPLFGGTPSRNGAVPRGDLPFLDARWRKLLAEQTTTKGLTDQATRFIQDKKLAFLPAAFPITGSVTLPNGRPVRLLVYRGYWGLQAINVETGELVWRAPSAWSMDVMVSKPNKQPALNQWVDYYKNNLRNPTLLFSNSTVSTLSTDNVLLYAVEDLAVTPPTLAEPDPRFNLGMQVQPHYDRTVADAILHNRLQAYSLARGKLVWEVGGLKAGALSDSFFLGAPLPLEDQLHVLVEKSGKISLASLDSRTGRLLEKVELYTPAKPLEKDGVRRMQAAHLAFADGRLVCPTNAGAVVALDVRKHKVLWTYSYRDNEPKEPQPEAIVPGLGRRRMPFELPQRTYWAVTAPVIVGDKVVFTAPDARSVHCVDLRSGKKVWTHTRQADDLFLAGVVKDRVLLVGKHNVRALSLNLGKEQWSLEVGLPSGLGIASDGIYYLPLRSAAKSRARRSAPSTWPGP